MSITRPTHHPQPQHSHPPPHQPTRYDLEITLLSGKHLKNVNWKTGPLKPYAIFWVDPDNKLTTKSDDSSNTKPVWNQRFSLPIPQSLNDAVFTLEIFHSKSSESPKPFVGSLLINLSSLPEPDNHSKLRTYDLLRPSGRPQGKIRLKLSITQHLIVVPQGSDYQNAPHTSYYYSSAPPYPYSSSRSASPAMNPPPPYSTGYYNGYYSSSPSPAPLPQQSVGRMGLGYGAPSAPVDYSPYEQQRSRVGFGFGTGVGVGVGAVAGGIGGIALDEGLKYEEEKVAAAAGGERVEENYLGSIKDDFSEYRADY